MLWLVCPGRLYRTLAKIQQKVMREVLSGKFTSHSCFAQLILLLQKPVLHDISQFLQKWSQLNLFLLGYAYLVLCLV